MRAPPMFSPFHLLILAFAGMVAGLPMPDEAFGPLFLGSAAAWVVALCLWLRAKWRARRRTKARAEQRARSAERRRAAKAAPRRWVVIDGSNVMYWQDEVPSLQSVSAVVGEVQRAGLTPVVWFDANVGYKVGGGYMNPADLARVLGVSRKQVKVAPKGSPADPLLLEEAAKLGTGVVTNDRYRDWAEAFPAVSEPGILVRGRVEGGTAQLDWPQGAAAA
ncbi:hypothetical protein GU927_006185 [Rhodobacteraceae bacterium HSP-20]|uniref:RNase NYN domain-containing protein n=1 Tax=Paragemmobacter amnigenus TaxID=2852097 RepID=A0ABS6J1L9_9RHOB|nr:hypothetical protein [Rhodobacter amnigenus]MBU9697432.1 hypothetical protein [Rhodobacter amnigenus]MBV4388659.1 hypothetical protein [Rhodobacter amnigenus]